MICCSASYVRLELFFIGWIPDRISQSHIFALGCTADIRRWGNISDRLDVGFACTDKILYMPLEPWLPYAVKDMNREILSSVQTTNNVAGLPHVHLSVCAAQQSVRVGGRAGLLGWLVCDKHTHTAQIYRQTASYLVLTQYSGGKCHTELALTVVLISTEISN